MLKNRRLVGFAAFTAIFAVLAVIVFWGTWSTGVTFVSPDDSPVFLQSYGDVLQRWWNGFLTTGKIQPTDILWSGLLGSPLFCREIKYVSALYLAGLALAWFLRGRGLGRLAAYGAGLFLSFSGYWATLFSAGHGGWFIWMSYGLFAFGLIDRAVERGALKYWLLLGLDVAWAGYQQQDLWLLFTAFTGVYLLFRLIVARERLVPVGLVRDLALSALVFALVGLPNWVSLAGVVKGREDQIARGENITTESKAENSPLEDRAARWEFVTNWSLPSDETLEFVRPRLNGDTSCPFVLSINAKNGIKPYEGALGRPLNAPRGNYRQHSLYVGRVSCLLAVLGILAGLVGPGRPGWTGPLDRKTVAFFSVAAVVFCLFSLGRYCEPVYRCIFALPAGDLIRCPVKWHHLTEFCLCVLAGYGLETLLRLIPVPRAALGRGVSNHLPRIVVAALILFGAFDLATEAHRFCAPVDYSKAVAKNCSSQLTVLPRQQFNDPQVSAMVRAGYIVSVANWLGSPDAYLVQVLQPLKPVLPATPKPIPLSLGILSVLTVLATLGFTLRSLTIPAAE